MPEQSSFSVEPTSGLHLRHYTRYSVPNNERLGIESKVVSLFYRNGEKRPVSCFVHGNQFDPIRMSPYTAAIFKETPTNFYNEAITNS